jgi:hypothetical protein
MTIRRCALAAALAGTACGSGAPAPAPIRSAACDDPTAKIQITDDTNYTLSDAFTIEKTTLKDATDLSFDWSALTVDYFGKAVAPASDIAQVLISLWNLTPAELADALKKDDLPLSTNIGVISTFPDGTYTAKNLLGFDLLGQPLPTDELWMRFDTSNPGFQYPQAFYTFMLSAASGTVVGKGTRMLSLFTIDPAATQTSLALTNASTKLDYTVSLTKGRPVQVPAGMPSLTIDWSQMTTNAIGNEYLYSQITLAAVAHYRGRTLGDLERQFLDLQDIADGWWSAPVIAGNSIDLGTLTDASGASFPGIDGDGIWMAALFCVDNCNNPAPWSITILQPCN